ncbi:MAG: DNA primase [Bacilli bacterium]|nr:DNA primase [Bacilli bacterium]
MAVDRKEIYDAIVQQADIVDVVRSRIQVSKKGRDFVSVCPFHDDHSPSMHISSEKKIFNCFSCHTGGDAIRFIELYDKIPRIEAAKVVCDICGIDIPQLKELEHKKTTNPILDPVYSCLENIQSFYKASLYQGKDYGKEGLNYLYNRGLNDDVIKYFGIGYSMDDGLNIINYLKSKNIAIKTIERTGIGRINTVNMTIRDNNAGRVIFPLFDKIGRVVGFSARRIKNDDTAKYINTESTEVFDKGKILYNLNNAAKEAKQTGYIYLLEGFMDVIALYRVGIKSAVALMGTAMTNDHVKELRSLNCEVRVCLDLDNPGQENTMKSIIPKLNAAGIKYSLVNNNVTFKEKDCDEILTSYGADALLKYANNLIDSGEWLINFHSKRVNLDSLNGKKKLVSEMSSYIASLNSSFDRNDYINKLVRLTGFDKNLLVEAIERKRKSQVDDDEWLDNFTKEATKTNKVEALERKIIKYMLVNSEAIKFVSENNVYLPDLKYREIASLLIQYLDSLNIENQKIEYSEVLSYVSSNNIENSDSISNNIAEIALDENDRTVPYSKEELEITIESLKDERAKVRDKQVLQNAKDQDPITRAKLYESTRNKRKNNNLGGNYGKKKD